MTSCCDPVTIDERNLIVVEKPINHHSSDFPDIERYTTLQDGTKHGRYIKEGKLKYYDNKIILYEECFYLNGKLHGKHSLWMMHQGQVYDYLQINNYCHGVLHGEQIYYEEHAWTPRRREYFDHGKLIRVFIKETYSKGYKANYDADGFKHGRCRTYYRTNTTDTSTLKTDGEWFHGLRVGVHSEYAQGTKYKQRGELLRERHYGPNDDDNQDRDRTGYKANELHHDNRYELSKN